LRTGYLPYLTRLTFFFYNATATTYIYTLSLHDALPISRPVCGRAGRVRAGNHRHDGARREALMAGLLGGGGGLRGHGELPLNADINVTSLVDVAFVLLIIFMITAPIMQGGVDVRLPRAEAKPLEPKSGLVVTVDREGRIFMDQTALTYADFRATFPAFVRTKRPTGVYLRADGRVPYAEVVQVLAAIRAAGVNDVGLVAEPEVVKP